MRNLRKISGQTSAIRHRLCGFGRTLLRRHVQVRRVCLRVPDEAAARQDRQSAASPVVASWGPKVIDVVRHHRSGGSCCTGAPW
jgi:hypothetical protein